MWSPYSAEAVRLHSEVMRLSKSGRITDAVDAIKRALEKAHRDGPSNTTYEEFERAEYERLDRDSTLD